MDIALVAASPVPFTMGGIEYLLLGLNKHINEDTKHRAELIKLPVDESSFWPLIKGYRDFYSLDLSHFDMVVSLKYPAWMVRHHNHVCYMAHRLRGLYDTYHLTGLPQSISTAHPFIKSIESALENDETSIDEVFDLLEELYNIRENVPSEVFMFPGPFIRRIIRFLDNRALSIGNIKRYCAISNTVKGRKDYFPTDDVDVIYPPSFLPSFQRGEYRYLFTVSRLDEAKRVSLIIQAMKYVKSDIQLMIAGTGPMEQELREMAQGDHRIHFLGFLRDSQIIRYYADALGVVYVPFDEDYGLVTIEAMMSCKPVITCNDSGGTNEFTQHGITGFVARPNPKSLAKQMDTLCEMPLESVKEMGNRARKKVWGITWEHLLSRLLDDNTSKHGSYAPSRVREKGKLTVVSTFPIYPPRGGGQSRIYNLYKNVARKYDVEIVSFSDINSRGFQGNIADNLKETRIPISQAHAERQMDIERKIGFPVSDIAMTHLSQYTADYAIKLREAIKDSEVVVLSHPYLYYEVSKYLGDKPFIYEAHNVEYLIKKDMLPDNKMGKKLLQWVYEVEKQCCSRSEFVMVCSEEDREKLSEIYNISKDKIIIVPNGVDVSETRFCSMECRRRNKKLNRLEGEKLVLFVGSWHQPNIEACRHIFNFAPKTPGIKYLLMGSQCDAVREWERPDNVGLLGMVDDKTKQRIFDSVDMAVNPILSGSGTNLKMFDYMAAGIPVITTQFGSRGMGQKEHLIICSIDDMPGAIKDAFARYESLEDMVKNARKYVEEAFDWRKIAEILLSRLSDIKH